MPEDRQQATALTKEQKIGIILLSVFALLAIGLGALQIRNTMYGPFALNNEIPASIKDQVNSPDALHYRDTDLDGINDFDELYIFSTSPYLADTDSDGINDKTEIDQGKNPTCAEGKQCSGVVLDAGVLPTTDTSTVPNQDPGVPPTDLNQMLSDPSQIRTMLKNAGVDEKIMDQFSDKDLINAVQEMMGSTSIMTNQINNLSSSSIFSP